MHHLCSQRTYREVVFLSQMGNHENIVQLKAVFRADNDRDLYLVFDYMETDLHATIRANILEEIHKQYILYQAFKALMYMHSAQLVHRDMKPANLLLNSECLMKVADFGLARSLLSTKDDLPPATQGPNTKQPDNPFYIDDNPIMTDYVATRWYRAPEILVGSLTYGTSVDLWSLGCIFCEMLGGKPVFPGNSTLNMIEKVGEVLGAPSGDDVRALQSTHVANMLDQMLFPSEERGVDGKRAMLPFNKASQPEPNSAGGALGASSSAADSSGGDVGGQPQLKSFSEETRRAIWRNSMYRKASDDAIDLLERLMQYDPQKRLTASEGLGHGYVAQFHDPETENPCASRVNILLTPSHAFSGARNGSTSAFTTTRSSHRQQVPRPAVCKMRRKSRHVSLATREPGGACIMSCHVFQLPCARYDTVIYKYKPIRVICPYHGMAVAKSFGPFLNIKPYFTQDSHLSSHGA